MGLFNRMKRAKSGNGSHAMPAGRATPDPDGMTPEEELRDAVMQTMGAPLGGQREAWTWSSGKLRKLKAAGVPAENLRLLERNILVNLTESYRDNFYEFKDLAGDATSIILTCEELLATNQVEKAKAIADPYYKWLTENPWVWSEGQLCFQDPIEASMYFLEHPDTGAVPKAQDNYTHFLVLYCRILDGIPYVDENDMRAKVGEKRKALDIALKISPCNATVWNALANVSEGEEEFRQRCDKALKYSLRGGAPYGLGQVYADMAIHYAVNDQDRELAWALCEAAEAYDGEPFGASLILAKVGFLPTPGASAAGILERAGIQFGYSETFREASALWEQMSSE